jgi:hypothetical protein
MMKNLLLVMMVVIQFKPLKKNFSIKDLKKLT